MRNQDGIKSALKQVNNDIPVKKIHEIRNEKQFRIVKKANTINNVKLIDSSTKELNTNKSMTSMTNMIPTSEIIKSHEVYPIHTQSEDKMIKDTLSSNNTFSPYKNTKKSTKSIEKLV